VKRVAIVGSGGAGKTHFARALGQALDLPVVQLDAHYYGSRWQPHPRNAGRSDSAAWPPPTAG